jgi:hypothetical protein
VKHEARAAASELGELREQLRLTVPGWGEGLGLASPKPSPKPAPAPAPKPKPGPKPNPTPTPNQVKGEKAVIVSSDLRRFAAG